jgi:hypothetical protein
LEIPVIEEVEVDAKTLAAIDRGLADVGVVCLRQRLLGLSH